MAGLGIPGLVSVGWVIHTLILDSKSTSNFFKAAPWVTLHLTEMEGQGLMLVEQLILKCDLDTEELAFETWISPELMDLQNWATASGIQTTIWLKAVEGLLRKIHHQAGKLWISLTEPNPETGLWVWWNCFVFVLVQITGDNLCLLLPR